MVDASEAPSTQRLEAALQAALRQPVAVVQLRRLTAGATKQTWLLDVNVHGVPQQLVLQTLPPGKLQSSDGATQRTLNPEQDAQITQLARAHGVPAPALVLRLDGSQGLGQGQVTRFVAGETLAPKILRDARYASARQQLTQQCAQALACTHGIPANMASFLPTKDAALQWQDNRSQVDASGLRHPALEWGLRWVEERLADHENPAPSPVHGDFRLGNFIVNQDGLAAVIDWELAHLGDPIQDLAWLCLRTWRFGGPGEVAGIGRRAELFTHYEQAGGQAVDKARVFFWEMACQVRWAVMCLGMGQGLPGADPRSVSLEHRLIGRRMEEPLWDMVQLARTRGDAA
jgi:aminoglycoside phosphotransferase (APT) family kinase protein